MNNVLIEVTREQQIELEEITHIKACSISQYLMGLHEENKDAILVNPVKRIEPTRKKQVKA